MGTDPCSWRNPRVLLILLLVFLCGGVAGALAMRYNLRTIHAHALPYWQEGGKEITLDNLKKELNLTPEQAAEIETILDDFVMYWQTLQAQMDEVRSTGKDRILRILKPEQQERFNQLLQEFQARQTQIR